MSIEEICKRAHDQLYEMKKLGILHNRCDVCKFTFPDVYALEYHQYRDH